MKEDSLFQGQPEREPSPCDGDYNVYELKEEESLINSTGAGDGDCSKGQDSIFNINTPQPMMSGENQISTLQTENSQDSTESAKLTGILGTML